MSCCPNKMPNAVSMAKDLASTALNAMRMAIRNGDILAQEDIVKKRITACNTCDNKLGVRCTKCGCYISLKTAVAAATCPIGKW